MEVEGSKIDDYQFLQCIDDLLSTPNMTMSKGNIEEKPIVKDGEIMDIGTKKDNKGLGTKGVSSSFKM